MQIEDILSSIDTTLEKNVPSYKNSIADTVMEELKNHVHTATSNSIEEVTPREKYFTLDRYEGDYAICEERATGKMYSIPKSQIDKEAKEGDTLQKEGDSYHINVEETQKQKETIQELLRQNQRRKHNEEN